MTTLDGAPATGDPVETIPPDPVDTVSSSVAPSDADAASSAEAAAGRVFASALGALEIYSIHLGTRLGWYRSLADDGPATPDELAARTGTQERYAREWLEQQAVCDLLRVDVDGRYRLPTGLAEALLDEHSLAFVGPVPAIFATIAAQLDALLDAYRNGGGIAWSQWGAVGREGQAALNRPLFESRLGDAIRGVSDLDQLLSRPGARIADVGCGAGWSTIALARAYPAATLTGIDIDEPTIALARANSEEAGLTDRIDFRAADARQLAAGSYDAVFAFECLHDMPFPVEVLEAMREATDPAGQVVIMDEAVADEFTAPGDEIERFMYGSSLFVCLPDGLSTPGSAGTGTVMRRSVLESYASAAGFGGVEVLPIEDFGFFRFYRLLR